MTTKITRYCDRCGDEFTADVTIEFRVLISGGGAFDCSLDLCQPCIGKLQDWSRPGDSEPRRARIFEHILQKALVSKNP